MNLHMTKPKKCHVRPVKTQISLGIRPVYQSLRCPHEESLGPYLPTECTAKTDQTGLMHRLICLRWAHMPVCWFCHVLAHIVSS